MYTKGGGSPRIQPTDFLDFGGTSPSQLDLRPPPSPGPGHISLRLAFPEPLEGFLTLVCGQLSRTAELDALGLRSLPAVVGAGKDQLPTATASPQCSRRAGWSSAI
jgi:hypothetical protein